MRLLLCCLAVAFLTACDITIFAPGDRCWYQYTRFTVRYDTIWNTVPRESLPDSLKPYWTPFQLVGVSIPSDSTFICP